jgi:HK97 family phage prohead protease
MGELVITRALPDTALEPIGDGWTVYGRAVPYDVTQSVDDGKGMYYERIARGAFARDAVKGGLWVNLMLGHAGDDGDRFLGRCLRLQDEPDGCYATFRLNRDHPRAEEARSGELTGWSVSARVYKSSHHREDGQPVLQRDLCGMMHVAATARPQYAGAGVLVMREHVETDATPLAPIRDKWASKYATALDARKGAGVS